jgi:ABC-type long-subunit fatty acid transport system fused permease/ATPase subunit
MINYFSFFSRKKPIFSSHFVRRFEWIIFSYFSFFELEKQTLIYIVENTIVYDFLLEYDYVRHGTICFEEGWLGISLHSELLGQSINQTSTR